MSVYKSAKKTSDGRCWFFKVQYSTYNDDTRKTHTSKKYATEAEALKEEKIYLDFMEKNKNVPIDMTFQELFDSFCEFKKDKVKFTTFQTYEDMYKHFKCFSKVRCVDYNIMQYEEWKKKIRRKKFSTRHYNDLVKFWKAILNYGTAWYNFNFLSTYRKMTNFTNPNERKKEMLFYTFAEFKQFLSVEEDFRFHCLWETLFYCGLRCGEARGLTWDNLDFKSKTLSVTKQVQDPPRGSGSDLHYIITNTKTKTSRRKIPMCDLLCNDLLKYKESIMDKPEYSENNFVFGNDYGKIPYIAFAVRTRSKKIADLAGVKKIRLHDFRHSCASLLINSGGNVTLIAKYLGHSEIEETLNTYSHMFPSAMDNVLSIINTIDKKTSN